MAFLRVILLSAITFSALFLFNAVALIGHFHIWFVVFVWLLFVAFVLLAPPSKEEKMRRKLEKMRRKLEKYHLNIEKNIHKMSPVTIEHECINNKKAQELIVSELKTRK